MKKAFLSLLVFFSIFTFGYSEHARNDLLIGADYIKGPFYEGYGFDFTIVAGSGFFFGGFDADVAGLTIDSKYQTPSSWNSIMFVSGDLLAGLSLKLGPFKPYVCAGLGLFVAGDLDTFLDSSSSSSGSSYSSSSGSDDLSTLIGLQAEAMGGFDFIFSNAFCIGAVYKLKYMYGAGFTDSYGITLGFGF